MGTKSRIALVVLLLPFCVLSWVYVVHVVPGLYLVFSVLWMVTAGLAVWGHRRRVRAPQVEGERVDPWRSK